MSPQGTIASHVKLFLDTFRKQPNTKYNWYHFHYSLLHTFFMLWSYFGYSCTEFDTLENIFHYFLNKKENNLWKVAIKQQTNTAQQLNPSPVSFSLFTGTYNPWKWVIAFSVGLQD